MGHLLKLNHAHSPLNLRIFSSTCVPFTLTTVQVPNLALTHKKRLTVCISVQNGIQRRGKDGMPHERENTRTGREKSFHSFRVRCGSGCGVALGCGVAQIVAHRLAVRQARVRISARYP